jgi:hypothetical protein
MKIQTAIIHRISQRFGLPAIIMKTEQPLVFVPGQYLAASSKSEKLN